MGRSGDLYAVLGVPRDAESDAVRKAYRKLARENHPDLNPGDKAAEERFKAISHAWQVLGDPEQRRLYDEFGEESLQAGFDADAARQAREAFGARFGAGGGPGRRGEGDFQFDGIDDLLGRFFGRRGEEAAGLQMRGSDMDASLELEFLDAMRGGTKRLSLHRPGPAGAVRTSSVDVRIPPGVADGGRLRIRGKGAPGMGGGPPGDLNVTLRVRPHAVFRREGRNLVFDLPLSVREAVQGARIEVPTLDSRAVLTVPPGTHSGTRLRLRGKGVPDPRGGKPGDLLARVEIRVPAGMDEAARRSLDALAEFEDPDIRKELFS